MTGALSSGRQRRQSARGEIDAPESTRGLDAGSAHSGRLTRHHRGADNSIQGRLFIQGGFRQRILLIENKWKNISGLKNKNVI
jgi:hypothetical protein